MHTGGSAYNIKKYPTTPGATSWIPVTNTQTEELFNATRNNAFSIFATGPYTTTPSNITSTSEITRLSATGALITGTQVYTDLPTTIHTFIGNP